MKILVYQTVVGLDLGADPITHCDAHGVKWLEFANGDRVRPSAVVGEVRPGVKLAEVYELLTDNWLDYESVVRLTEGE